MATTTATSVAPGRGRPTWIGPVAHAADDLAQVAERGVFPFFDLFVRLWLAQSLWASGLAKLNDWPTALYLAEFEYPVSWLDPATAAYLGVTVEILGPIFLVLGLATRFAAIPMLALSWLAHLHYPQVSRELFHVILFGWYIAVGAGPISLDRLIGRGLAATPLPLARPLAVLFGLIKTYIGPVYMLFVRYWIAAIFFISGLVKIGDLDVAVFRFQQEYETTALVAYLATFVELVFPVLLVVGVGTRLATLPLIILTLTLQFTFRDHIDHLYWLLLLGLILLRGPGPVSVDHWIGTRLRAAYPRNADLSWSHFRDLPNVVIVGAGFAGVSAARALGDAPCRVTLIDRHNYHLFQPLLYQVATAALSPADIATPIREIFRSQPNVRVLLGRVTDVDAADKAVVMEDARISYDYLVLATGARHSYFGRDEWEDLAPGLKKIEDATAIRRRLLVAFERAENTDDPDLQKEYMTFIIVGGGPTGVELAGAIAELARQGMQREFRNIDPADARVLLIQSAPRLLPPFPERLSAKTERSLRDLGVEVRTGARVEDVDPTGVKIGGDRVPARTVFWAAGVFASPAAKWLSADHDRSGRVKVGPDLTVPGQPEIFVVGDTALSEGWEGKPVPGLAPAAKQSGKHAAEVIKARLTGRRPPNPFRYRHAGSLATIGRKSAVADFGWIKLSGALAWWLWGLVHVYFLVGNRNRIQVAIKWFWAYLTFNRGTRLITGDGG